ncbi:hypothetical protein LguiA_005787 [Lonicera macranthoides]
MVSLKDLPSLSSLFSLYASLSASIMLFQTMLNKLIPHQFQRYLINTILNFIKPRTTSMTLIIEENTGITRNQLFDDSEAYLCTNLTADVESLRISKSPKDDNVSLKFSQTETIIDSYKDITLKWRFVSIERDSKIERKFELSFDKKYKERVMNEYMSLVMSKAKAIKDEKRVVKIHTLSQNAYTGNMWDSINLGHPTTFDKIAMEEQMKRDLIEDLDRFANREEFYRRVGKAWKRGYLLYGPPGTGKSSLIAAIANYLRYDIYDLQLTDVTSDSKLRKFLLSTTNKSILVIEDIDCSVKLPDRRAPKQFDEPRLQFSLSGLLNFIDGLWSSCGDERIIIFTTNNKEKLDPALLRPGRMDMHVHMSYLTTDGFKLLASNYLNIQNRYCRIEEIEELIESMEVTPAEVAGELMKSDNADISLEGLLNFLKCKKIASNEVKMDERGENGTELDEGKEREECGSDIAETTLGSEDDDF